MTAGDQERGREGGPGRMPQGRRHHNGVSRRLLSPAPLFSPLYFLQHARPGRLFPKETPKKAPSYPHS
jgi:hypothetical protein